MKLQDIEIVTWQDAAGGDGKWRALSDEEKVGLIDCITVGFVADETKERLLLVSTQNRDGDCIDFCHIPKKSIVRRRKLKGRK